MERHRHAVIWRLLDGRPGHENQVIGLSTAIHRRMPSRLIDIAVTGALRGWRSLWLPRREFPAGLPNPDLLIGAGHSTHLPLLRLQRQFGGRTVVVMKPSLPLSLFDLCLVPEHDRVPRGNRNVVRIEGSLNRMRPSNGQREDRGLMLIGGPSKHFRWCSRQILRQVAEVICRTPEVSWTLTTSERTPHDFLSELPTFRLPARVLRCEQVQREWLPGQMELSATAWVTPDSVSMIYEALTCGSAVGVFDLPVRRCGRVSGSVQRLIRQHHVTSWSEWQAGRPLTRPTIPVWETERCATAVIQHCLNGDMMRRSFVLDTGRLPAGHSAPTTFPLPCPQG